MQCSANGHYYLKSLSFVPSTVGMQCDRAVQHAGGQQLTARLGKKENVVAQHKTPAHPENAICSRVFTQSRQILSALVFQRARQKAHK